MIPNNGTGPVEDSQPKTIVEDGFTLWEFLGKRLDSKLRLTASQHFAISLRNIYFFASNLRLRRRSYHNTRLSI